MGSKNPKVIARPRRALLGLGAPSAFHGRHSECRTGSRRRLCATASRRSERLRRRPAHSRLGRNPGVSKGRAHTTAFGSTQASRDRAMRRSQLVQREHVGLDHRGVRSRSKGELSLGGLRRTRDGSGRLNRLSLAGRVLEDRRSVGHSTGAWSSVWTAPPCHQSVRSRRTGTVVQPFRRATSANSGTVAIAAAIGKAQGCRGL